MRFNTGSQVDFTKLYPYHLTRYLIGRRVTTMVNTNIQEFSTFYLPEESGKGLKAELDEVPPLKPTADFD